MNEYNLKALIPIFSIFIAQIGFAEPITVTLKVTNGQHAEVIKVPLEIAEMSQTIKNLLTDSESIAETWKTDGKEHVVELPITSDINYRTLFSITNALAAIRKLQQSKKEITFSKVKTIINDFSSLPPPKNPARAKAMLDFLFAANFLDIPDLLRPAAAVWLDIQLGGVSLAKRPSELLKEKNVQKELLPLKDAPQELISYIDDYWESLNPKFMPKTVFRFDGKRSDGSKLDANSVWKDIRGVATSNNKLYLLFSYGVEVIDLKNNKRLKTIDMRSPRLPVVAGNSLYVFVALGGDHDKSAVSVIDTSKDAVIKSYLKIPKIPASSALVGTKLYVSWSYQIGAITVIDLATNHPNIDILPNTKPNALAAVNNRLFVSIPDENSIKEIDTTTNQEIASYKLEGTPYKLTIADNKLFATTGHGKPIETIDLDSGLIEKAPIEGENLTPMASFGTVLFCLDEIHHYSNPIIMFDTRTKKTMGKPINFANEPVSIKVFGSKLFVSMKFGEVKMVDVEKLLYYSK